MTSPVKENPPRIPPYKTAAAVFLVVAAVVLALVWLQFRGGLTPKTPLTMVAPRAGLVMDPGSKVTYNGVEIGRVASISEIQRDGTPAAKFVLDVNPEYIKLIPANVDAKIKATTVFGNKYVSLTSPKNPAPQRVTTQQVIDARSVTTEFNTLFETLNSIVEKVDPVKVNLTLAAAAQALTGLGDKFGQSIVNGNAILDDINPRCRSSDMTFAAGGPGRHLRQRRTGSVGLPQQRGHHGSHAAPAGSRPGCRVAGRDRVG